MTLIQFRTVASTFEVNKAIYSLEDQIWDKSRVNSCVKVIHRSTAFLMHD